MSTSTLSKDTPFIDISEGIALALSHAIIDTVRDPLLVLDQDQRIVAASRSFYQTFKLVGCDLRGSLIFDIDGGQWDIFECSSCGTAVSVTHATFKSGRPQEMLAR